jgi:hypothetical protein
MRGIQHPYKPDLPPILVPHVKLEFCHFLFLNAGMPPVLEDGNSKRYLHCSDEGTQFISITGS